MWRRYVLGKGGTTVIGYGTSKAFKLHIHQRLHHLSKLKPDLRHIYKQYEDSGEDENFFRRQVLLDSTHYAQELLVLCPSIDPNASFEDCMLTAVDAGVLHKEALEQHPQLVQIYRMARFQAGPITEVHYNDFRSTIEKIMKFDQTIAATTAL
jgi:hypothetical protein